MIEAALRGKLTYLGAEDALTSVVFGSLRYLNPGVLWEWMRYARNLAGETLETPLSTSAEIRFWPGYPDTLRRVGMVEPDVVVDDGIHSVVIEAKLRSGKSPTSFETTEGEWEAADQLAREWHAAIHAANAGRHSKPKALVYLTGHWTMPRGELLKSVAELEKHGVPNAPIYWLPWNALELPLLSRAHKNELPERIIAFDVLEYLRAANLLRFGGWKVNSVHVDWGYQAREREYAGWRNGLVMPAGARRSADWASWTYGSHCLYFESLKASRHSWAYGSA